MLEISGLTWGVTIALVLGLLAVDLVLAAMRPHKVGFKEALAWSVFYIGVADRVRRLVRGRLRR